MSTKSIKRKLDISKIIEFLKNKDPDEEYNYDHTQECLIGLLIDAPAIPFTTHVEYDAIVCQGYPDIPIPDTINAIAAEAPYTFGAALARAESIKNGITRAVKFYEGNQASLIYLG